MKHAATLDRHDTQEEKQDAREHVREERSVKWEIAYYRNACTALLQHSVISAKTRSEYQSMLDGLEGEKNAAMMIKENVGYLKDTISEAVGYQASFEGQLTVALSKKWISKESAARWEKRFADPDLLEWTRKTWVKNTFPKFMANWAQNAARREKLLDRFDGNIDAEDLHDIAVLQDENAFLKLKYGAQKNLLATLEAADMALLRGKKKLLTQARALLKQASTGDRRSIHPSKTGALLKRMMDAKSPEAFHAAVLLPNLEEHLETRNAFDALGKDIALAENISFPMPKLETFLLWDSAKRSSCIEEGQRRLALAREEQALRDTEEREQNARKKQIQETMDMGDWEGASLLLDEAVSLHAHDKDLAVMRRYLEAHRTDVEEEQEQTTILETKQDIASLLEDVPQSARHLYAAALGGGSETFGAMVESMYKGAQEIPDKKEQPRKHVAQAAKKHPAAESTKSEPKDVEPLEDEEAEEKTEDIRVELDSKDEQEAALDALTEESLFDDARPAVMTIADTTNERQMQYHTQINLPILSKLRQLERRGERYEMAA